MGSQIMEPDVRFEMLTISLLYQKLAEWAERRQPAQPRD